MGTTLLLLAGTAFLRPRRVGVGLVHPAPNLAKWSGADGLRAGSIRGAESTAQQLISLRARTNKLTVFPALSVFRILQRFVRSYLGIGALDRLSRYIYDGAYALPQW
jgi:hypothetical protein